MQPFTIEEIAQMVHGVWKNPRPGMAPISAVCTDSRSVIPGSLFLPWVGERFDGHRFIDAALEAASRIHYNQMYWFYSFVGIRF